MTIKPLGPSKDLGSVDAIFDGITPVSAGLKNGKVAVAWAQTLVFPAGGFTDTDGAIFVQLYSAGGKPSGAVKLVNMTTAGIQGSPEITALKDGGFVMSWVSYAPLGQGHNDTDIHARIFNANGSPRGKEIIVTRDDPHTVTGGSNYDDDNTSGNVIATRDGGFLAIWTDGGPNEGAFAQRFDAQGGRVGKEVEITTDGFVFLPGIAELSNGNFVAVNDDSYPVNLWISGAGLNDAPTGISGTGKGRYEVDLDETGTRRDHPEVAALKNGGFALVWKQYPATGSNNLRVETYDKAARLVKAVEIDVPNGADSVRNDFNILGLSNGGFIVAWTQNEADVGTDSVGIKAQAFNGDGTVAGPARFLNSNSAGVQYLHDMTETADGKVWVSYVDQSAIGTVDQLQYRLFEVTADAGKSQPVGPKQIYGTAKDDTLKGSAGADEITARGGDDVVRALGGKDVVDAGSGADRVLGGDGDDTLRGGGDNDTLLGEAGNDKVFGQTGNDTLDGGDGNDRLVGGGGADTLRGGKGRDTLNGSAGADTLKGDSGDDRIAGGGAGDRLVGGAGDDTLNGGAGNDKLYGNGGNDVLIGGGGRDTFIFAGATGDDVITDFDPESDSYTIKTKATVTEVAKAGGVLISWAENSLLLEGLTLDDIA
ncbi:calcium-binding protein [Tropicimonas sediminicola]|nr:calcium-binding protein [Tropicimonas sediminicola]